MADSFVRGSSVKAARNSEALYPGEFTDSHPDGKVPPRPPLWDSHQLSLPIHHLSHITHNKEACRIGENPSSYTFLSRQKVGKEVEFDGSPIGNSFKKITDDKYVRIHRPTPIFPGFLSWWGISLRSWYETSKEYNFQTLLSYIQFLRCGERVFEADYLKQPPDSKYGSKEFIFSWNDLIESYKQSRTDCKRKRVYLKKAGTLRYRHEVCYVVMIVMETDLENDSIGGMPSLFGERIFEHNGCIDEDGQLIGEAIPSFKIKHPFSWIEEEKSISWESLVFAFYFAKDGQMLQCPKGCGREEEVHHDHDRCLSKQPPPQDWEDRSFVCPNLL